MTEPGPEPIEDQQSRPPAAGSVTRRLSDRRRMPGAAACLLLAFLAQRSLDGESGLRAGVLLYALAAGGFGLLLRDVALEREVEEPAGGKPAAVNRARLILGLALACAGCLDMGDNTFRPLGTALWLGGLAWVMLQLARLGPELPSARRLRAW